MGVLLTFWFGPKAPGTFIPVCVVPSPEFCMADGIITLPRSIRQLYYTSLKTLESHQLIAR